MELSTAYVHSPSTTLLALVSLGWTFLVLTALSWRGRSAAPVAAVLVPLALFTAGLWIGLINTLRGMAIAGTRLRASTAAGFADSFTLLCTGLFFAALVIVFAALRRHRAFADGVTATIFALLVAEIAAARYAIAHLEPSVWIYHLVPVILALIVAVAAMIWTFLTGRGRVTSTAIPYGITIMLAIAVIAGVIVWQTVQRYHAIAMSG